MEMLEAQERLEFSQKEIDEMSETDFLIFTMVLYILQQKTKERIKALKDSLKEKKDEAVNESKSPVDEMPKVAHHSV